MNAIPPICCESIVPELTAQAPNTGVQTSAWMSFWLAVWTFLRQWPTQLAHRRCEALVRKTEAEATGIALTDKANYEKEMAGAMQLRLEAEGRYQIAVATAALIEAVTKRVLAQTHANLGINDLFEQVQKVIEGARRVSGNGAAGPPGIEDKPYDG